jgi:YggT family protein
MIANALEFLLQTLLGLFTLVLLLRFYFQLTGVSYKNPISQTLLAMTDFVARPTRRFIPNWGNISLSVLFLAFLVQILLQFSLLWIRDFPFMVAGSTVWVALLALALLSLLK